MRRVILALAACTAVGTASAKQDGSVEFSATHVIRIPELGQTHVKLYVSNDRMRVESQVWGIESVGLTDLRTGKVVVWIPQKKIATELSALPPGFQGLSALHRMQESEDPCAGRADYTCERLGTERVGGLSAQKWHMVPRNPTQGLREMRVWIAPELGRGHPVRTEDAEGNTMELTDIKLGKQPDSLFEVPAGYRKVDVDSLF
ncbi:DUF4412 domain-containing protein [Archangium lipolyticum]|uniref:DUF4412 domain-containing protein n=1 Tax=Archangium lipolyticum TaxID=2970465 RepID=UPI002149FF50|nr:DUF4412 domain-containing protein [Archangium lipolyticum]